MQFGDYRVEIIPDTEFRLDGGAMFGVVPRNLWAKVCPPDDENRIRMNMNCVFIDTGDERILIETGIGEKWSAKHTAMFGIDRKRPFAESLRAIAEVGPESISIVINTHLHFDHSGGNTTLNGANEAVPAFPNARYFISQAEVDHAETPSERDRASYFPENWRPLKASGQLETKKANYEVVPGLHMETYPGHNRSMQCWRLTAGEQTLFGFADLVPMRAHVPFPWIMGYDLYPVETLEVKKKILPQAAREGWNCLFYHDPDEPLCRIEEREGKLSAVPIQPQAS
jgi:glyoxylase-like metal-dependent hydrolase (beta-lactamase superfamily II)